MKRLIGSMVAIMLGFLVLSCETRQVKPNTTTEKSFSDHPLSSPLLPVLTVQVQRQPADNQEALLHLQAVVQHEIGDTLWNRGMGVRYGIGVSDTSIDARFRVMNTEEALPVIVSILRKRDLGSHAVIRETKTVSKDSAAERVVYPK